jgi:hypothetical protein
LSAGILVAGPLAVTVGLTAAREKALDPQVSRTVELASSEITGKVGYPDGRSVAAQAPVRVWSVLEAAFVQQTVTGKDGTYHLPALAKGTYQLVFADRVRVELHVTDGIGLKPAVLDVVIPHGKAVFADVPIERKAAVLTALSAPALVEPIGAVPAEPAADVGLGLLPTVAIGAGGITAVAAVANLGGSSGRREVNSP